MRNGDVVASMLRGGAYVLTCLVGLRAGVSGWQASSSSAESVALH